MEDEDFTRVFNLFKKKELSNEEVNLQVQADRVLYVIRRTLFKLNMLAHMPMFLEDDARLLEHSLKPHELQFALDLLSSCGCCLDTKRTTEKAKEARLSQFFPAFAKINKQAKKVPVISHMDEFPDPAIFQLVDILFYNKCIRKAIKNATDPPIDKNVVTFMLWLSRLKETVKPLIYTTGGNHFKNEQELRAVYRMNVSLVKEIVELRQKLHHQREEFKQQLEQKRELAESYREKRSKSITFIDMDCKKTVQFSEDQMMKVCLSSESRQAELTEEAEQIVHTYDTILRQNIEEENKERAKRLKVESQLMGWINTFDQDSMEKQATWEEAMEEFNALNTKMADMNRKLAAQDLVYANVLKEKAEEEERIFNEMAYQLYLRRCAVRLTVYWRMFVTKRLMKKKKR
ncbi:unnamed protein product, partial [Phyllotreta striolata]